MERKVTFDTTEILDMAVETYQEIISEHGIAIKCNCFRAQFATRLHDYMECKEREWEDVEQADIDEIKRAIRDGYLG